METGLPAARKLIEKNAQTQSPILDLGNLRLTEVPEELFELKHLEVVVPWCWVL